MITSISQTECKFKSTTDPQSIITFNSFLNPNSLGTLKFYKENYVKKTNKTLSLKLIEYIDLDTNKDCPVDSWIQSILGESQFTHDPKGSGLAI